VLQLDVHRNYVEVFVIFQERIGRKQLFFEKKNQKTFVHLAEPIRRSRSQTDKSFLLLFFKKEGLSFALGAPQAGTFQTRGLAA